MITKRMYISVARHILIILIFLVGPAVYLLAQNQVYRHLTTRDGLPSGYIWEMFQDSKGFIWVATNAGLSRYDGYSFTNFRPQADDPFSISGQSVRSIKEIDENTFLIGSNAGLDIYYPGREAFKKINVVDSVPDIAGVVGIERLNNGDIWIAVDEGLYLITEKDLNAESVPIRYFKLDPDNRLQDPQQINTLEWDGTNTLWVGTNADLFTFDMNTRKFSLREFPEEDVNKIFKGNIWTIHKASEGSLIISSNTGLAIWREGDTRPEAVNELGPYHKDELSSAGFQSITEDQDGRIWLGTGYIGAICWDLASNTVTTYRADPETEQSIHSDDVHYAFMDNQGNTWFGYHSLGISLMWSISWNYKYLRAMDEFGVEEPENDLYDVVEDESGNLWFATAAGLVYYPLGNERAVKYSPDGDTNTGRTGFASISMHGEKFILISLDRQKTYSFNRSTRTFSMIYEHDTPILLPEPPVETESKFYFSSFNEYVIQVDKSTGITSRIQVPYDKTIKAATRIASIRRDAGDNCYVLFVYIDPGAVQLEVYRFDPADNSFEKAEWPSSLTTTSISPPHLSRYEPGILYGRIGNGIMRLNILTGESSLLFQQDVGVINESSGRMIEDNQGYLWMSNQTGIMKLDPVTESITTFETGRDLHQIPTTPAQMNNGDILFIGKGGFIRFDPENLEKENPLQNIYITDLMIDEARYNVLYNPVNFEIESSERNFVISFLGLNFRDPSSTRYRYRINDYNEGWNRTGTQRSIFIANLPPGKYTFQVQAATRFGAFGDQAAEMEFTILPPWWRTVPAYITYLLILVAGVFAIDRIQRGRLVKKERERTREKELEQAREIEKAYHELKTTQNQLIQAEKMASLGELTAGIAHEIQNPLNFINNFSEVNSEIIDEIKEELEKGDIDEAKLLANNLTDNEKKIMFHGKRADSIVKGMLLHSRGSSGIKEWVDVNVLAEEYLRLAYHGMRAKDKSFNADFKTKLDGSIEKIEVVPQEIGRVFLNLINNAFYAVDRKSKSKLKDSSDSNGYKPEVIVTTLKKRGRVEIRVKDNGEGIPENVREKIFQPFFTTKPTGEGTGLGLSMSYEIITNGHKGTLKVESTEGEGTEFIIELPQN